MKYEIDNKAIQTLFLYLEEMPHKYAKQIEIFLHQNLKLIRVEKEVLQECLKPIEEKKESFKEGLEPVEKEKPSENPEG
jgi:hypothetical protein